MITRRSLLSAASLACAIGATGVAESFQHSAIEGAVSEATRSLEGQLVDLVEFGTLKAWPDGKEGKTISRKGRQWWRAMPNRGTPEQSNIGVEWDEPREFSEVRFSLRKPVPIQEIKVEYWVSAWPAASQGGWAQTDSPWQGEWRAIHVEPESVGGSWCLCFSPLSDEENPNAKNQADYAPRFRRALKLRLLFTSTQPAELTQFEVVGLSRWNARDLLVQTGCGGKPPVAVAVSVYNGRIASSRTSENSTHLRVLFLEHAPESSDETIVTLKLADLAFGVAVDDLLRQKGMFVEPLGVFISDGPTGETFDSYLAAGRLRPGADILSRVGVHEEQSLERAMGEIPALSMTSRSGSHTRRYIPVGMFANREKYGVEYNGNFFVSKNGSKLFKEEVARMMWNGDEIAFKIGTGSVPDFREREHSARQQVVDGYQPVVQTEWTTDGTEYREEVFATLVGVPLEMWEIRGDEISAMLVKLTAHNPSSTPRLASVWLDVAPHENLTLRGNMLFGTGDTSGDYAHPRLRGVLRSGAGDFKLEALVPETGQTTHGARWLHEIGAGESVELSFIFTFRTLTEDSEIRRLVALDYNAERARVMRFWDSATSQGMRLHVPDEILNGFYRAVLTHILLSVYRDVPTGLYMAPCGTYDYNIFANETDMQVRLLNMRGLHEMAKKFLEPLIALQGSKPFPGRFHDTSAMLHGVRLDADHDYTSNGYNLDHGWTLWTMAEHYLFTHDQDWLRSKLPNFRKAAEWIISERQATMKTDADGHKVWEYGLLPAGELEDNKEWEYWFAVNAYAYRGLSATAEALADLDSTESNRLKLEAESYRQDLRNAAFRSMAACPIVPLQDGTWVPTIGTRTQAHGRDVGWIRNILYGSHVLVDCGVIAPNESAATWILKDLEDNLFMSSESFSVAPQDWFNRGGITLQPNLVNTTVTYLERDEVPQAVRTFYNAFAVGYYPDVNMFTEWEPSFGLSGGPFFKTSDESGSLTWLRLMLVRESQNKLYLACGAPRRWFEHGEYIQLQGAATFFGPVDFRIDSHAADGYEEATVRLPEKFSGSEVVMRLCHPQGKPIIRVEMDGVGWDQFQPVEGLISFPAAAGMKRFRAFF